MCRHMEICGLANLTYSASVAFTSESLVVTTWWSITLLKILALLWVTPYPVSLWLLIVDISLV